jgi:hypothetical protein
LHLDLVTLRDEAGNELRELFWLKLIVKEIAETDL